MFTVDLADLRTAFAELTDSRGWAPVQTPRNMTLALTSKVGAVAGHLQFASDEATSPEAASAEMLADLADCLVYLLALADATRIDVVAEATRRIRGALAEPTADVPTQASS